MATKDNKGDAKKPKPEDPKQFQHLITPRPYNQGEIRSLLEIVEEFNPKQIQVMVHETTATRYLDVRTEIPQRARFIDFLMDRVAAKQKEIEALYNREDPATPDPS